MDPTTPFLKAVPSILKVLLENRKDLKTWAACQIPPRGREVRFVLSHLLRVCHNGRYLLIRNSHRPETLAPIGGVAKYYPQAQPLFDSLSFRGHVVDHNSSDNERDIRGFLPKRQVPTLHALCRDSSMCESAPECLRREIREELGEIGLTVPSVVNNLKFRIKWTVTEPLAPVDHQPYLTHRRFLISELIDDEAAKRFIRILAKKADGEKMSFCSEEEIRRGRSGTNRILAATSSYLFSPEALKNPLSSIPFKL